MAFRSRPNLRLLVGLGNPGPKYVATRHNFGFLLLDEVDRILDSNRAWSLKTVREIPKLGRWKQYSKDDSDCHLLWPLTFMNLSGHAVTKLLEALEHETFDVKTDLLVAIDDLSLSLGRVRLRGKGSSGGHNGLRSIESQLGHSEYGRVKLGIGRPESMEPVVDFVLEPFSDTEKALVQQVLDYVAPRAIEWLEGQTLEKLSQTVNGWKAESSQDDDVFSSSETGTSI